MDSHRQFFWKRMHSLSGVVPVGLFLILHFYSASFSVKGPQAFNHRLETVKAMPWMLPVEIFLIYLPILFHGILGVILSIRAKYNLLTYRYFNNLRFVLQRFSGVGLFLFVGAHVYKTRIDPWMHGIPLNFYHMAEGLREPLTFTVYMFGILGAAFHLANGLATFCITWGLTISPRAQARMTSVALVLFLVISFIGLNSVFGFLGMGINI